MDQRVHESLPFKTFEELYEKLDNLCNWPSTVELRESTEYVFKGLDVVKKKAQLQKFNREDQPRTLVCHDMKGGYLEDRFIDGSIAHDAYTFYHWNVIDTFVYFSHHFITIPPYGWINAAHSHGVKVLGTVITEKTGIWDKILESQEAANRFADALIVLSKFYKFEGWLLNIENFIELSDVDNLLYFVRYLTERIHAEINGSEIIWYDSVTSTGKLEWQNELNDKNKDFFLNCDGIYLNYSWNDSRLSSSCTVAKLHNRNIKDIYVGLDVWGRGCPGGGGFNSAYALETIRKQGLSVAIFAPGWTHEYFGSSTFQEVEDIFWAQLLPYLYIHVPIYDNETFKTSFCRGAGVTYYHCGEIQQNVQATNGSRSFELRPFFNLSLQNPQVSVPAPHLQFTHKANNLEPENEQCEKSQEPVECVYKTVMKIMRVCGNIVNLQTISPEPEINYYEFCNQFSYEGGGCFRIVTSNHSLYHRLFLVHIDFTQDIQATIIYKEGESKALSDTSRNEPTLILGNDIGLKSISSHESVELSTRGNGWRKCIYLTNMKTANEIGVSFAKEGECYLGEIVLEQMQRRFGEFDMCDMTRTIMYRV